MTTACPNPACTWATTGVCFRQSELASGAACPDLGAIPRQGGGPEHEHSSSGKSESLVDAAPTELADPQLSSTRFWFGTALGLDEANAQAWRPDTRVILVAGEEDTGKTCLLVAGWVQLASRLLSDHPWRFAGSRSLLQWSWLTRKSFDWKGDRTRILPRTSFDSHRGSAFLHLDLTANHGQHLTSLLLTDFPGEWFEDWVEDRTNIQGRLDFLHRVDGVCLVVDLKRLSSDKAYRERTGYLAERLRGAMPAAPVAYVLTKVDEVEKTLSPDESLPGPEHAHDASRWPARLARRLPSTWQPFVEGRGPWRVFPTAAFAKPWTEGQPKEALRPFLWLLEVTDPRHRPPPVEPPPPPPTPHAPVDYFACMRDREAT